MVRARTEAVARKLAVVLISLAGAAACGGPTSPSTPSLSSSEVQILAKQFASVAVNGANAGSQQGTRASASMPFSAAAPRFFQPLTTCNASGCQIFQQYSQTTTCQTGGRASAVGTISGAVTANNLGVFGTIGLQQTDSIVDWTCTGNWTVNGDPYISDAGTITFTGTHSSFSFRQGGGWMATNGAARTSCQENTSVQWDSSTGGIVSGTVACSPGGTFNVNQTF